MSALTETVSACLCEVILCCATRIVQHDALQTRRDTRTGSAPDAYMVCTIASREARRSLNRGSTKRDAREDTVTTTQPKHNSKFQDSQDQCISERAMRPPRYNIVDLVTNKKTSDIEQTQARATFIAHTAPAPSYHNISRFLHSTQQNHQ
jgi:hypothetical protein